MRGTRHAPSLDEVIDVHGTVREVSIAYVRYALACYADNKVRTAEQIGIDRRTIQRWLPRTYE